MRRKLDFLGMAIFSAHRRAADSANRLAVAIVIPELVAPSLGRASGMVAVLESKTHGNGCLAVLIVWCSLEGRRGRAGAD